MYFDVHPLNPDENLQFDTGYLSNLPFPTCYEEFNMAVYVAKIIPGYEAL